ncbi:MAG: LytR C-terminal domain-containing protein [Actinobacteria bacterium]|nr:LytR C-terminal domain-containing protein [Actinomycetota bacterium]
MHLIQEIGSYAGFAAVVGLALLSALYFSQARDVKRLREWAGRAPERAAEAESGGRPATISASRVTAQPRATPAPASPIASPPQQAAAAAAKQPAHAGDGEASPAHGPAPSPVPAASPVARGTAVASASAGAVATAPPQAGSATEGGDEGTDSENGGSSGPPTGAKVLPPRPSPPPRFAPARPAAASNARNPGSTAVMSPAMAGENRRLPPPRTLMLIVAALVVIGVGAAFAVIVLTDTGGSTTASQSASTSKPAAAAHHKRKHRSFPPAIDPSTVTVAVLNGTSVPGLAAKIGSRIQASGFKLGNVTNAARAGQRTESVVMFKSGANRQARAVARKIGISQIEPIDTPSSSLSGAASVVVVVGADQATR